VSSGGGRRGEPPLRDLVAQPRRMRGSFLQLGAVGVEQPLYILVLY
jgi:hypothetical protein